MHVALVVHDFSPNFGQGRYSVEIVRRLASRCSFTIFANTFGVPPIKGVEFCKIPAFRKHALTSVFSFLPFAEAAVRRTRPDLVHAQGITCWNADIITAHMCHAAKAKAYSKSDSRARWFMRVIIPLERAYYRQRRARHVIAISRVFEREIQTEYGWKKPSTVIYHGTDTKVFRPALDARERLGLRRRFQISESAWCWLFMGEAIKGLRQSITALKAYPGARLLVVSRSDLTLYRRQAEADGVADRVIFHGFEPRPEEAFRAADVFIYPSDYDPFGMVATEAMATGLPVILGQEIGAAELVQHGRNGFLCDPGDEATIQQALKTTSGDPAAALELGRQGRETIGGISWDHCADQTFAVYEKVYAELATRAR